MKMRLKKNSIKYLLHIIGTHVKKKYLHRLCIQMLFYNTSILLVLQKVIYNKNDFCIILYFYTFNILYKFVCT